jgi:hypothetical protein
MPSMSDFGGQAPGATPNDGKHRADTNGKFFRLQKLDIALSSMENRRNFVWLLTLANRWLV